MTRFSFRFCFEGKYCLYWVFFLVCFYSKGFCKILRDIIMLKVFLFRFFREKDEESIKGLSEKQRILRFFARLWETYRDSIRLNKILWLKFSLFIPIQFECVIKIKNERKLAVWTSITMSCGCSSYIWFFPSFLPFLHIICSIL